MKRRERGFSLVELMVSVVILAVGLLTLAGGSIFVTRSLTRARASTVADAIARSKADELRAAAAVPPACGSSRFRSSIAPTTSSGVTIWWTVSAGGALRTVRVMTSYRPGRGAVRTDTLTTQVPC